MPRKRDPNKPIRLRTRLETAEEINEELRRTYRLQRNKEITAAEAKSWRELLVALRSGLPETTERPPSSAPTSFTVVSAAEGQQFSPGEPDERVLMPFDEAGVCWTAYHGGAESWTAYLVEVEGHLTRKSFENLSRVPPLERARFLPGEAPTLRLVPDPVPALAHAPTLEGEASTPEELQLVAAVTDLFDVVRQLGLGDKLDPLERALNALRPDCR